MPRLSLLPAALTASLCWAAGSAAAFQDGEKIGVWSMSCETGMCQAYLTLEADGKDILTWTTTTNPDAKLVTAILTAPVGTALPPGIRLWTGETTFVDVPFQVCDAKACTAVAVLDPAVRMVLAGSATVRASYFVYGQPNPTVFDVPIKGFGSALSALEQK